MIEDNPEWVVYKNLMQALYEKSPARVSVAGSVESISHITAKTLYDCHKAFYTPANMCLVIVGEVDEKEVIAKINEAKPDVLFVCLGAPKQEKFIKEHFEELDVTLMLGLGGSLDGYAGVAQRAPKWMIDMSLEWLYRLLKEPKRLGRMMRLPKFVLACGGEKLRRKKNG